MCGILMRYLACDASMHEELEANAAFSAPLNVLACEEVGSKRVRNDEEDNEALPPPLSTSSPVRRLAPNDEEDN